MDDSCSVRTASVTPKVSGDTARFGTVPPSFEDAYPPSGGYNPYLSRTLLRSPFGGTTAVLFAWSVLVAPPLSVRVVCELVAREIFSSGLPRVVPMV